MVDPVIWPALVTLALTAAAVTWLHRQARDWPYSRARTWSLWAQVEYRALFIPARPRTGRVDITRLTGVACLDHGDHDPARIAIAYRTGDPYALRLTISTADQTRVLVLARDLINTALRDGYAGNGPLRLATETTGMLHLTATVQGEHTKLWVPGLPLLRATIRWERLVPTGTERTDVDAVLIRLLDQRYLG